MEFLTMLKQTDLIKRYASIFTVFHTLCSALVAVLLLTSCTTVAPRCQVPLEHKTTAGSGEGSATVEFLCEGVVVHQEPGFRAPAYSPDGMFIIMRQAGADDDLQLYLFPTDEHGLPNHQRSFGAFGGRYSGLIAWNQNSRGFFLYHPIHRRQASSMRDKFSYYHIVTEGETLSSIAESYFGRNGSRHVGAFIDANPWVKDAAQQQLDGGYAPWRRVIKGWDPKVSDVPVNGVLNLSNVVLEN
jgi:hypothetical protein